MKKKKYILSLSITLIIIIITLILFKDHYNFMQENLYEINKNFYIKETKSDCYCPTYEIINKKNKKLIISNVKNIYEFSKAILLEYNFKSNKKYLLIFLESKNIKNYENLELFLNDFKIKNIEWISPKQFIKSKIYPINLIIQLLSMTIVLIIVFLLKKYFNLKLIAN